MRWLGAACAAFMLGMIGIGCSVGEGSGSIEGSLNVPDCWSGRFVFEPDFFAGVPFKRSAEIRIQEGGDFTTYSDGVSILVRDLDAIRGDGRDKPSRLGEALQVKIPSEVTPPGVPLVPDPNPALVDFALRLQRTCRTQNVALYAGTVSLNADGTCDKVDTSPLDCRKTTSAPASPATTPTAQSFITFQHLFNGVPDEADAAQRLIDASFDVYLADPREVCPDGSGPPPRCRGHITGNFRFYFERGRPAQRFP